MTLKLTVALYTALTLAAVCRARAQDQPAPIPQDSASPVPVYKIGNGVTPPREIRHVDPEFSDQARAARYQGTCVLSVVVGEDGKPAFAPSVGALYIRKSALPDGKIPQTLTVTVTI